MQITSTPTAPQTVAPPPSRATGTRVGAIDAVTAVDTASTRDDALAQRPLPVRNPARRSQPAAMLYAMFDQMGGAETSVWKGMYVNTVI